MLDSIIGRFFVGCVYLVAGIIAGIMRFFILLTGPVFFTVIVVGVVLWYFGWLTPLWNAAVSLIW